MNSADGPALMRRRHTFNARYATGGVDLPSGLDGFAPGIALGLGAVLGLAHALEPDHVSAVVTMGAGRSDRPLSARIRDGIRRFLLLGAAWGAGHATTLVLFGMLVYAAASLMHDWVFSGLEVAAGVMLLALGVHTVLRRQAPGLRHDHPHRHDDGTVHSHEHDHAGEHRHAHRSYAVGLVHGLAGSGGVVALAISAPEGPVSALAFTLVFGLGAAAGMCLVGGLLGIPLALAGGRARLRRALAYAAGAVSIIIGAGIIYQSGMAGHIL